MDTRLIVQAFANILKNASESISARRAQDGETMAGEIKVSLQIADALARIEIVDNGLGLPMQGRKRLLEPYMTTRAKGTGLGLAIVVRAFEEHGGALELADRIDGARGACIKLTLPVAELADGKSRPGMPRSENVETLDGR
jgi:two-component system, NtrC family, nitrogen regulation sensor histidine kinase NtrY